MDGENERTEAGIEGTTGTAIVYTNSKGEMYDGHIQLMYIDGIHADIQVDIDGSSKFFENVPHIPGGHGAWEYATEPDDTFNEPVSDVPAS